MAPRDFEVVEETTVDVEQIIGLLSAGYGRPFSEEWFRWKHEEGPWGPSRCFVARDAEGLLGVAFRMNWPMRAGRGPVRVCRLVDGTTSPRALRRGVFREVVRAMLDRWPAEGNAELVLATATPEAQIAHVKNGAVALDPIEFAYRPVRPSRARLRGGEAVLDEYVAPVAPELHTAWSPASLRWRTDPRSGAEYRLAALADAEHSNGAAYRVAGRNGVRAISLTTTWGAPTEVAALTRAIAFKERAVAVHAPVGAGSAAAPGMALRRGRSLMCIWQPTTDQRNGPAVSRLANWHLENADLEGLI